MIASLKETHQHPSADAKQMADLKKLVADVQLLHRNGADGGGGAAPRGGGGGRGASRGAAGNSTGDPVITALCSPRPPVDLGHACDVVTGMFLRYGQLAGRATRRQALAREVGGAWDA